MLEVRGLTRSFGGLKAVDDVSFTVPERSVYAIIGPNGAGKTTLFNVISGIYRPSAGSILVGTTDVSRLPPEGLARLGVSRTFQNLQVCMNMGALENVMVGAHLGLDGSLLIGLLRWRGMRAADRACRARAAELMAFAGVAGYVDAAADEMPYGALKRLEIARALAADPKLLLLDEPVAGLNQTETGEVAALIRRVADSGVTVVLVEHDMKMVMSLSDRVLVLDHGRRLAEGTAAEVQRDPDVIRAYLGAGAGMPTGRVGAEPS